VTIPLVLLVATLARGEGVDRVLIDRGLDEQDVVVLRLGDGMIVYDDELGLRRHEPTDLYLAMIDQDPPPAPPVEDGVLELVTGERLLGRVAARQRVDDEGQTSEALWWRRLGRDPVRVPLDLIDRVVLDPSAHLEPEPASDVVLLRNGDTLRGFVESIGATVSVDTGAAPGEVALDAVAIIDLANPPEPFDGMVAWLDDGSVLGVTSLSPGDGGTVRLLDAREAPDETEAADVLAEDVPLDRLSGVEFAPGSLRTLGSITPESWAPAPGRRWSEPLGVRADAALGLSDIDLPGPMTVRWIIPAGATRFATTGELPEGMRTWGDCDLVVAVESRSGEVELARHRLNAASPVARINAELPAPGEARRRLRITLEPGAYGPIQDRVTLRRPMLLVEH